MKILRFLGTGASHEAKGQACQDRILTETFADGKTILAVADGCSSSLYGGEAAQCNVQVVRDIFSRCNIGSLDFSVFAELYPGIKKVERTYRDDLTACFDFAFKTSLFELSKKLTHKNTRRFDFEDYCATVLFAVCEKEKTFICHVGDGNVICFDKNGNVVYHSKEENGSDSSHTYFTARSDFYNHFHYKIMSSADIECIVMFSDGPQNMFKCEFGDIVTGVRELIALPVLNGEINSNRAIFEVLKERIGHAKHYVADDWSLVVARKDAETENEDEPVSLYGIFKESFDKIKFDEFGNVISDENVHTLLDAVSQKISNRKKTHSHLPKSNV